MVKCAAPDCTVAATQRCPSCKELGVPEADSSFCSKACFQQAWEVHKLTHKRWKDAQAEAVRLAMASGMMGRAGVRLPKGFEGFSFTGALRPGTVSPQMTVPAHIQKPDYADTGIPRSELAEKGKNIIPVVSASEAQLLREAGVIGREVLDLAARALKPGVTADEIDRLVFAACVERGAYPSPLNYHGFPKSVCTSVNEVCQDRWLGGCVCMIHDSTQLLHTQEAADGCIRCASY